MNNIYIDNPQCIVYTAELRYQATIKQISDEYLLELLL